MRQQKTPFLRQHNAANLARFYTKFPAIILAIKPSPVNLRSWIVSLHLRHILDIWAALPQTVCRSALQHCNIPPFSRHNVSIKRWHHNPLTVPAQYTRRYECNATESRANAILTAIRSSSSQSVRLRLCLWKSCSPLGGWVRLRVEHDVTASVSAPYAPELCLQLSVTGNGERALLNVAHGNDRVDEYVQYKDAEGGKSTVVVSWYSDWLYPMVIPWYPKVLQQWYMSRKLG